MYLQRYAIFMPGLYGALRSCFYFTKVNEQPLYTDMVLLTGVNAIAHYSPLMCYSMYKDMCILESAMRGLPQPPKVPIYFLVDDEWDQKNKTNGTGRLHGTVVHTLPECDPYE